MCPLMYIPVLTIYAQNLFFFSYPMRVQDQIGEDGPKDAVQDWHSALAAGLSRQLFLGDFRLAKIDSSSRLLTCLFAHSPPRESRTAVRVQCLHRSGTHIVHLGHPSVLHQGLQGAAADEGAPGARKCQG